MTRTAKIELTIKEIEALEQAKGVEFNEIAENDADLIRIAEEKTGLDVVTATTDAEYIEFEYETEDEDWEEENPHEIILPNPILY